MKKLIQHVALYQDHGVLEGQNIAIDGSSKPTNLHTIVTSFTSPRKNFPSFLQRKKRRRPEYETEQK